jgi:hypothetical protein
LIIWHLKRVVPRLEVSLFTRKMLIIATVRSQGYDKKGLKVFCSSAFVISPDPYAINFFSYEESRKHSKGP